MTKKYKDRCKREFSALGFKSYENNFYRVINDVFQSFTLHKSISGNDCTIEFTVVPLCMGNVIKKNLCGANHIKMFENDYSWFSYNKNDKKSIDKCIDLMLEYMKKHLIRHFESANNTKSAYYEIYDFQQKHYKSGVLLSDYSLFCMALKSRLYDKSLEHIKAQKKQIEDAYKRNKECFGKQLDPEYENIIIEKIKKIEFKIKMISNTNTEFIDNFIVENEKSALLNLGMGMNT